MIMGNLAERNCLDWDPLKSKVIIQRNYVIHDRPMGKSTK